MKFEKVVIKNSRNFEDVELLSNKNIFLGWNDWLEIYRRLENEL